MIKGYILYKIYYKNDLVYLGRTKQNLQIRLRGHFFGKPMHRKIDINQVTKIEYANFKSESDMFLYEVYYINKYKPALNVGNKAHDDLTINLPDIKFIEFRCKLMDKWIAQINEENSKYEQEKKEKQIRFELSRKMRKKWHNGEISEDEYYKFKENNDRYIESLNV